MNLTDIISLAKQGYKPNDIKELIALAEPMETEQPAPPENPAEEAPVMEEQKEPVKQEPVEVIDYKALYEESQKKLHAAQQANINTNIQGSTQSDLDLVMEWAKS